MNVAKAVASLMEGLHKMDAMLEKEVQAFTKVACNPTGTRGHLWSAVKARMSCQQCQQAVGGGEERKGDW